MEPYLFQGRVLPERAPITLQFQAEISLVASGARLKIEVSIVLNQLMAWAFTDQVWDILDLKNNVASVIQHHLAMVSFLRGMAYDFEVSRVSNRNRNVDYVFGIDIPCLAEVRAQRNIQADMRTLAAKSSGIHGVFLERCFTDLVLSMRHADDTGFYCYRAIEALRNHCAAVHGVQSGNRSAEWAKFREVSGQAEDTIRLVAEAAKPLRHGNVRDITNQERGNLFQTTWAIVEAYLDKVGQAE